MNTMTPGEVKKYIKECVRSTDFTGKNFHSTGSIIRDSDRSGSISPADRKSQISLSLEKDKEAYIDELWEDGISRNRKLADIFKQLAIEHKVHKDYFRHQAYSKAADIISNYKIPIISGKQANKIKGIGKGISGKIDEFIKTGKVPQLGKKVGLEEVKIVKKFMKIWGVGPVKARDLYSKGYREIDEIPISELDNSQRIGRKYIDELNKKIPRGEIMEFEKKLKDIIKGIDERYKFCICGSYRRGLPFSGDIDVLITFPEEGKETDHISVIVSALQKENILTDTLALGKKKYMGVGLINHTHRRIDIRYIEPSSWGAGVLYFTGSKQFNIDMRNQVKAKGYLLNEWGIWDEKTGKYIPAENEKDIFKILKIKYVPLDQRV